MFFPERIKSINANDKVLEIGPGANPFERSDVLLELKYENEEDLVAQFGHTQKLVTDKKVVYYSGDKFPFADNEFDYIICSHVLEHVPDVELFLSEIFRVSSKGYFEYPLIYYEYLYNFDVHLNFLKYDGEILHYMKKSDSTLNNFRPIQDFFYESLKQGHVKLIDDLLPLMMEGFEWNRKFKAVRTMEISKVSLPNFIIPQPVNSPPSQSVKTLIKQLIRKIIPA